MITRSAARKAKSGIPTPTYPTAHFLSLAPELIYRIGDEAELEDLLALRLACKSCAALLRWIVYRSLTIDIKWDTYSPVLDKLELLAKTKDHPARLATKELNLKLISGTYGRRDTKVVSYERRVKALLVPALQALKNVSKLRWNNSFAKVQQVEKDVLGGIKHIIPNLTSLEISGINIGYSNSYDNLGSLETPLEILANPRLPRLTRLAISAHGQKDPSHGPNMVFLSSLMKATTKILANSRATLQSFEFRIPFGAVAAHGSFPPTFQTLFKLESVDSIVSPNSSDASVPMDSYTALTHLVIDTDFISAVRSATLTIPQLPSLQSLDIWQAYDYYPARTPEAALSTKVDIWTALINTRVRLRSLTKINISPDFLQYLSANSSGAELGKLEITCHVNMDISNSNGERETRERQRQQEMGAELFTRAIIPHRAFLESFAIWTNNSGWWVFGQELAAAACFSSVNSWPQLRELHLSVYMAETMGEVSQEVEPGNNGALSMKTDYVRVLIDLISQQALFPSFKTLYLRPARPPTCTSFTVRFTDRHEGIEAKLRSAINLRLEGYRFQSNSNSTTILPTIVMRRAWSNPRVEWHPVETPDGRWQYRREGVEVSTWDPTTTKRRKGFQRKTVGEDGTV